ncbi:MAG: glycosyltransferase family 4 protein [Phycisphaerae bacterium]|nr:glycosyltransferase family 4 protein [Phycisphaerae bacterium]
MKLLYIHQHFVTNEGHGGTRSYNVSRALVRHGWDVTVITGIFDQGPFVGKVRGLFHTEWIDGIKVVVCNVRYSNYQGFLGRLWAFAGFVMLATIAALRERAVDLVFATSTPLTVGWPGLIAGYAKRRPFVFEVRDIWPEDLLLAGAMKPGVFAAVMTWMERLFYKKASRVLTVSPGFTRRLAERGVPLWVLETIPLGGDGEIYADLRPDTTWIERYGLSGKTIAIYAGAHGYVNGLEYVVKAAEHLRDRQDIAIVLLGDGQQKPALRQMAEDRGLSNVVFADPVARSRVPGALSACQIALMILRDSPGMARVLPNKLFDYMFAGLPTVVNFAGTTQELVDSLGAGVGCDPHDPADLARQISHLADHPDRCRAMGQIARETALEKFDRRRLAEHIMAVFETCRRERPRRADHCRVR